MIGIFGRNCDKNKLFFVSNNSIEILFSLNSKHSKHSNVSYIQNDRHFHCVANRFPKHLNSNLRSNHFLSTKFKNEILFCRSLWGKNKPGETKPGVRSKDVALASRLFKEIPDRHKEHFLQVVDNFGNHKFVKRQGYVEFITAALPYLKEFGVHRDIQVYKALMNVFPKGRYRPDNVFAAGFFHFPLEQSTAVEILCAMEENGMTDPMFLPLVWCLVCRSNARQRDGDHYYWDIQQIFVSVEEMRANDILDDQIHECQPFPTSRPFTIRCIRVGSFGHQKNVYWRPNQDQCSVG